MAIKTAVFRAARVAVVISLNKLPMMYIDCYQVSADIIISEDIIMINET